MFWIFLLILLFSIVLIKLGSYYAWVGILLGGLKLAALVIVYLVVAAFLRNYFRKKNSSSKSQP